MLASLNRFLEVAVGYAWGMPLVVLLIGSGASRPTCAMPESTVPESTVPESTMPESMVITPE